MTIAAVTARLLSAPLRRSWGPGVDQNHVVVVTVRSDDGREGTGFGWVPQIGPRAVLALVEDDLAPFVIGMPETPAVVWDAAWTHLHEAGAGLPTVALAALDLALWDLDLRRADVGLATRLGRRRDAVRTYGSGVNLHYDLDELVDQARRFVAAGHTAVKIKVGRPDPGEDAERVAAVREVLGPDRLLMIDANQRWDLPTARPAIRRLAAYDLHWVEEPLRAEDVAGHARLRRAVDVPIAVGENLHSTYWFADYIEREAVDIVQPNVCRVGGITPFLRVVDLARVHSLAVAPHLLPDLSGQLAVAVPGEALVEDIENAWFGALGLLAADGPVRLGGGRLTVAEGPGLGLTFR